MATVSLSQINGRCMRINPVGVERATAAAACAAEGAELAHVPDRETQEALETRLKEKAATMDKFAMTFAYWLGGIRAGEQWEWEGHEEAKFEDFSHWSNSQPGIVSQREKCTRMGMLSIF